MPTNPKASVNPFHALLPQVFKRNGEVRRTSNAPRFSRQLVMKADQLVPNILRSSSVTIETPFGLMVMTEGMTTMLKQEDGMFHAMIYNGWNVYATPLALSDMLPETLVQTELEIE